MDIEILKALADENRLAIVALLVSGERCICEVATELGLSDALVSHHVKRLVDTGIVRVRRVGRWRHCRLDDQVLQTLGQQITALADAARTAPPTVGGCSACASEGTHEEEV